MHFSKHLDVPFTIIFTDIIVDVKSNIPVVPFPVLVTVPLGAGEGASRNIGKFNLQTLHQPVIQFNLRALGGWRTKQSGAVEACWAHNPEVRGSKPRSAKTFLDF